ncbi:carbohydrate ABC transporter permease [Aureimonas leprariae]|uniref:Sugar ABC transporter permease n=1 Tax=Plantimonas leprariae TaxID=2615207 RepID=A0A7V7PTG5_9HYPH|nr:sugar ABC transporter permease [Aureimonas leprariae]KAB0682942.1 sugar ABC transporter permease [Aureimonas leprariae]
MAVSIEAAGPQRAGSASLRLRRAILGDAALGIALSLPVILLMTALVFAPALVSLWDSFHRVNPMLPGEPFIGLRNYTQMFADPAVRAAWWNTWIYVVLAVALELAAGLAAALLLNALRIGRRWMLAAVILPWALPPVVNAIVWAWIYNPRYGLLNGLLVQLGLLEETGRVWMNSQGTALVLVTLVHVWRMMPLNAVILLAALQSVPNELYEAAKVDGSTPWHSFRTITLPLISGALGIALTQSTITAFNLFDEAWILNGASATTRPIQGQIYITAFQNLRFSYGMAMSITVMLVSVAVSALYVRRIYRETRYD